MKQARRQPRHLYTDYERACKVARANAYTFRRSYVVSDITGGWLVERRADVEARPAAAMLSIVYDTSQTETETETD